MLDVQYIKETGKICSITPSIVGASPLLKEAAARGVTFCMESVPDQPYTHLRGPHGEWDAEWPGQFVRYTTAERTALIDVDTDTAISVALHPASSRGEELGILRDVFLYLYNYLGIDPPAEFVRLNEIAIAEIENDQARKAVL